MYNGVGLATPKGSGTSGFVQRSLSHIQERKKSSRDYSDTQQGPKKRKPNAELLEHERKRQIEIKCLRLRDSLVESGKYTEEEIELQIKDLRTSLSKTQVGLQLKEASDTHRLDQLKKEKMETLQDALHINKNSKEGESFQNIPHK